MINSPLAQSGKEVLIHQAESDSDEDWSEMMELLAETEGIDVRGCEGRSAVLCRVLPAGIDQVEVVASDLEPIR
ncbi:DUF1654 domain-containing protein [Pseudomonas mosselii]|nr:DUF1654 domain-containing protein [Pseudomonas mosselii]